jgi:hypothetical protein
MVLLSHGLAIRPPLTNQPRALNPRNPNASFICNSSVGCAGNRASCQRWCQYIKAGTKVRMTGITTANGAST